MGKKKGEENSDLAPVNLSGSNSSTMVKVIALRRKEKVKKIESNKNQRR